MSAERLRVALLAPLFESVPPRRYGGTERVVSNLCIGLERAGVDVTLFASGDSVTTSKLHAVIPEAIRLGKIKIEDPVPHLQMIATVAKHLGEFDIVHNHHDFWQLPLAAMSKVQGTPFLSTLHGRLDLPDAASIYNGFPDSHFISISDSQRLPLPQLQWSKTIYHGIDVERFPFYPKPGNYLAFLGRISPEKRPEWAIQIAKEAGIPLKIAAKIEGKAGRDYYDEHLKPHVDGKFIEYVGEINEEEKSDFLGNALALVFPIDWPEPFGLVMIESLAHGTPILARPCGSVPEILKNGLTGFSDLDIHNLAKRALDIPNLSRLKCREWVENKFSIKRMTEDYIDVYEGLRVHSQYR